MILNKFDLLQQSYFNEYARLMCSLISFLLITMFCVPGYTSELECGFGSLSHDGETFNSQSRSYNFHGTCGMGTLEDVKNMYYTATGTWKKATGAASEKVISECGVLLREFHCDFDPWLEPGASCTVRSESWAQQKPSGPPLTCQNFPLLFTLTGERRFMSFPVTSGVIDDDYRREKAEEIMVSSLMIIDPEQNESFDSADIIVTTVMERPVINPPDYAVVLKLTELEWPDPENETREPRTISEIKSYLATSGKLVTYFNLADKDLWGSKWTASAHLVSANSTWSSQIIFEVGDSPYQQFSLNIPTKPQIHAPRANHTYSISDYLPFMVSFEKGADLHFQFSYRDESGQFRSEPEVVIAAEDQVHPGNFENYSKGIIAFQAGSDVAEIKVRAWVSKKEAAPGGIPVTKVSEVSQVTTRVIINPLLIVSPEDDRVYGVPAKVLFKIPYVYGDLDFAVEDHVEAEMQWIPVAAGSSGMPAVFRPYAGGEFTTFRSGENLYIVFACNDIGSYRLRARIMIPPTIHIANGATTPWTNWKPVQVKGFVGEQASIDVSQLSQKSSPALIKKKTLPEMTMDKSSLVEQKPLLVGMPVLLQPADNQEFSRKGVVPLKVKGLAAGNELEWQLEYKGFGKNRFRKTGMRGLHFTPVKEHGNGNFQVLKEGYFRIRLRLKEKGRLWSRWTIFTVGKPTVFVNNQKKLQSVKLGRPGKSFSRSDDSDSSDSKMEKKNNQPTINKKPSIQKKNDRKFHMK